MDLITAVLAVLWAWECLLVLSPVTLPAWAAPFVLAALAASTALVPHRVLAAAAMAAAVAVLHRVLTPTAPANLVVKRRTRGLPPL